MKTRKLSVLALIFFLPVVVFAAENGGILAVIEQLQKILNSLLPVATGLALLFFIWGLAQFIRNSGDEEAKKEGKNKMIWGIIAIFVIVSIWGIVGFIGTSLGIETTGAGPVSPPQYPQYNNSASQNPSAVQSCEQRCASSPSYYSCLARCNSGN